jgi:hypothetical protein
VIASQYSFEKETKLLIVIWGKNSYSVGVLFCSFFYINMLFENTLDDIEAIVEN